MGYQDVLKVVSHLDKHAKYKAIQQSEAYIRIAENTRRGLLVDFSTNVTTYQVA